MPLMTTGAGVYPAIGGGGGGTAFTWNPADAAPAVTLANSNRDFTGSSNSNYASVRTTIGKASGLWYCELVVNTVTVTQPSFGVGIANASFSLVAGNYLGSADKSAMYWWAGQTTFNSAAIANPNAIPATQNLAVSDIIQVALDATTGKVWLGQNNTWKTGSPSAGTSPWLTFTAGSDTWFVSGTQNAIAGTSAAAVMQLAASTTYTPPTGFTVINA